MRARSPVEVRIGLPYLPGRADHAFLATILELGAESLISAGSLYRADRGWATAPITAWSFSPALDSAGFVAQARFGGYRWSVAEYVERVVTNFSGGNDDEDPPRWALPFPWAWWSAPDFCCEAEIAQDPSEVQARIGATVDAYGETLGELEGWRREGENVVPDPLPILQGRTPDDYQSCAEALAEVIDEQSPCTCPSGDIEGCPATWHREARGLPALVGVGSVCRRPLHGPEGLIAVLDALHAALPERTRLHLFGVKTASLQHLGRYGDRIASVDSVAWDRAARWDALKAGVSNDLQHRAGALRRWFASQQKHQRAGELIDLAGNSLRASPPPGLSADDIERFLSRHHARLVKLAASALRRAA
ncbi:MAG: hypothetical protein IPI35_24810 [Deltaproteobacteria bacterium]|nr:hypothetical protein [Deltaproteobacteria bacterium]